MFYAAIPGMPELGMVWMGDMMVHNDPAQEIMIDPRQTTNNFYSHSYDDLGNHQIQPTATVRYVTPQFNNECSEHEESMERVGGLDIQQEYNQSDAQEINEYLGLEDYMVDEEQEQAVINAATQTQDSRSRKIKPIKHPGLVLKTPIAYEPHTNLNFIPIRKDGMAVCEKCGAIGVKHAFYTRERRFCSRACARTSEHSTVQAELNSNFNPVEQKQEVIHTPKDIKPIVKQIKEEVISPKENIVKENRKQMKDCADGFSILLPRKKRSTEMVKSYDWTPQLKAPGFCAAPVSCFKHAPISEMWDDISVGMKVEVANTDRGEDFPNSFWVATVLRISGYRALLRYEGFGQSVEYDFWVSLCSNDIHPVGWCASIGEPLIPPKTIANKYKDWKDFLTRRLTGARTLPTNFYNTVHDSMKSRFRCGLNVEVIDKNRISQVKVATIQEIVGKRLHVRYYDSMPDDPCGFWCHEDSPLLHPVGWAKRIGHNIDCSLEYLHRIESGKLCKDDARGDLFIKVRNHFAHVRPAFQEGMKIEAIDPLNLSAICAATIMKVLHEGFMMIRIDSYDEDSTGADWFCYNSRSPCIFPIGFCTQHGLPFTPPKGYDPTVFSWDSYLQETNTIAAPLHLFDCEIPQHGFIEGMRLEAADLMDPRLVCVATITRVIGRLLRVHFDGWEDEYDQWLDCQSPDIYPVGWCDLVDHKLEGPCLSVGKIVSLPPTKSPKCLKRRGRRKRRNYSTRTILTRNLLSRQSELLHQQARLETVDDQACSPAQGVKIEHDRGEVTSIPEQSFGPELALEPAGPDQTMPSSTDGHGLAEQLNCLSSAEPLPKERVPTPRIDAMTTNDKYIPRITNGFPKGSLLELVPCEWNLFDVAQFLRINDCAAYCDNFNKRNIDGTTLLTLTKDQIFDLTGFKVGPSLKIFDLVQQLKSKVNVSQERLKFGLKKSVQ